MARGRDLSLSETLAWEQEAERRNVSAVARGEARSADGGFLAAYRKAKTLSNLPEYWRKKRQGFIARHMAQLEKNGEPLFESNGRPTRRHLGLIMWAFTPASNLPRRNPRPPPPRPIHPAIIEQKRREEREREWERKRPAVEIPIPQPPPEDPRRRYSNEVDFDLARHNGRGERKLFRKALKQAESRLARLAPPDSVWFTYPYRGILCTNDYEPDHPIYRLLNGHEIYVVMTDPPKYLGEPVIRMGAGSRRLHYWATGWKSNGRQAQEEPVLVTCVHPMNALERLYYAVQEAEDGDL